MELTLSTLPKTWLFDIDGTLVKHNGYKEGGDVLLPGVRESGEAPSPDIPAACLHHAEPDGLRQGSREGEGPDGEDGLHWSLRRKARRGG